MIKPPKLVERFARDQKGAIAFLAAFSMLGVLGAGGLAIDYSRGAQARSALFAATDAAALAGARTFGTPAQREAAARAVFRANTANHPTLQNIGMTPTNILRDGRNYGYQVRAQGDIKTTIGRILGIDELGIATFAEAIAAIGTRTEVALVLDTTYSMTGWKIDTLKLAATRMVDELHAMNPPADHLKISVIPFSQYVNMGMANRNKPWANVPADYVESIPQACYEQRDRVGQTNCRMVNFPAEPGRPGTPGTPAGTCYNDGVPYSCGGSGPRPPRPGRPARTEEVCDPVYGPPRQVCPPPRLVEHKWHGCMGSRNNPLDTRDTDYANRIPGLLDITCGTPIVELTSSAGPVKTTIASLTPNGETYIPQGLLWGWMQLSPQAPLPSHMPSPDAKVRKFLVLMTDGFNTKSPTYPEHNGSDTAVANERMREICRNIAADRVSNITIYSVAFAVNDNSVKNILRGCASQTNGQFFDATNADQFVEAFSKITSLIAELRLSK